MFAEDGFESQPVAWLGSNGSWIDASSGLPIPSGNHALLVEDNAVILHLKRRDGSTKVSLRLVGLMRAASDAADSAEPTVDFQSAVIGSTNRVEQQASAGTPALPTSHATWTLATEPRTVEFELHDSGTDVAVEISRSLACSGTPQFGWAGCNTVSNALIIDDLHIE